MMLYKSNFVSCKIKFKKTKHSSVRNANKLHVNVNNNYFITGSRLSGAGPLVFFSFPFFNYFFFILRMHLSKFGMQNPTFWDLPKFGLE